MGVRSLQSFVSSRGEFYKDCHLKDCYLIIDGHNLIYSLYNRCPRRNCCFGGDYAKFHKVATRFFEELDKAGVKAVVVLDGAYDDAKKKTLWQRGRERAFRAVRCNPSNQNTNVILPIFAKQTFIAAVKSSKGASVFNTFFEADLHLAVIAYRLDAPVLSNDSDFFIFNVRVISVDSLLDGMDDNGLTCKEFDRSKFLKKFDIKDRHLLQLFAVLMGNDYVNTHSFDRIFAQISMPKGKTISQRHRKMLGLLKWMSKQPNVTSAVDTLMNIVPLQHRESCRKKLTKTLNMYGMDGYGNENDVNKVVETVLEEEMTKLKETVEIENDEYFRKYFYCDVPAEPAINLIVNHGFFVQSQVECKDEMSSHLFALPIVNRIIKTSLALRSNPLNDPVRMICRHGAKIATVKLDVTGMKECNDVIELLTEQPLELAQDDAKWILVVASMMFWIQKLTEKPNDVDVMAVAILTTMYDLGIKEPPKDLAFVNMDFKLHAVNKFNNLQSVIFHSIILNRLLGSPQPEIPNGLLFWHGTFLYNASYFCHSIKDLANRFSFNLDLSNLIESRYKRWEQIIKPKVKPVEQVPRRRRDRRVREKIIPEETPESSEPDSDIGEPDEYNDLGNKFALLSVV